jgi:hypothetical protein
VENHERSVVADYPTPIAEALRRVSELHEPVVVHTALFHLAETALQYLALVAWSEYRALAPRDAAVEQLVSSTRKPAMGHWLQLLGAASSAHSNGLLRFPLSQRLDPRVMERAGRFVTAWDAVKRAMSYEMRTDRVPRFVQNEAVERSRQPSVLEFWEAVIHCRNTWAHPKPGTDRAWEYHPDEHVTGLLNPLLHEALLEVLCLEPMRVALAEYVWATPRTTSVDWDRERGMFLLKLRPRRIAGARDVVLADAVAPKPIGWLVRIADGKAHVPFDFDAGWPAPREADEAAPPTPPSVPPAAEPVPKPVPPIDGEALLAAMIADALEDGRVSDDERRLLDKQAARLGVSASRVRELIDERAPRGSVSGTEEVGIGDPAFDPGGLQLELGTAHLRARGGEWTILLEGARSRITRGFSGTPSAGVFHVAESDLAEARLAGATRGALTKLLLLSSVGKRDTAAIHALAWALWPASVLGAPGLGRGPRMRDLRITAKAAAALMERIVVTAGIEAAIIGFYFAPDIPEHKARKAITAYCEGARARDMVLLHDDTLWGSATEGYTLTTQGMSWKPFMEAGSRRAWMDVAAVRELRTAERVTILLDDTPVWSEPAGSEEARVVGALVELAHALFTTPVAP